MTQLTRHLCSGATAPDGTPVTNFSVATRQVVSKERVAECPQGWKESLNGKYWELTIWFRITAWRRLAEGNFLGDPITDHPRIHIL